MLNIFYIIREQKRISSNSNSNILCRHCLFFFSLRQKILKKKQFHLQQDCYQKGCHKPGCGSCNVEHGIPINSKR